MKKFIVFIIIFTIITIIGMPTPASADSQLIGTSTQGAANAPNGYVFATKFTAFLLFKNQFMDK